jgi:hypothetical protein
MRKTVIVCCIGLLFISGCALMQRDVKEDSPQSKQNTVNQTFYGFPDIPVPKELEFVRNRSFVYETPNLKAGVMVLSGNVDLQSLENYFKVNMIKNGWKFVNSFKFSDITLNFSKDDKTCSIKMSKPAFNAEVEIWVGPTPSQTPRGTDMNHKGKD